MRSLFLYLTLFVLLVSGVEADASVTLPASCKNRKLDTFMHVGHAEDDPPEKVYNFVSIRKQLLTSLESRPDTCLADFYQSGLEQAGHYWGERLAEEGCQLTDDGQIEGECPSTSEARKSITYISNLNEEMKTSLDRRLEESEEAAAAAQVQAKAEQAVATTAPVCSQATAAQSLKEARNALCCGTPTEAIGAIRAVEPKISYNMCLAKMQPTNQRFLSGGGIASCIGNAVAAAAQLMWDSVTSLFKLPGELWAARSQIWSLVTSSKARAEFAAKLQQAIVQFFKDRFQAYGCYNDYEKAQYLCKTGGQIIASCAMPETMGAFLGLASKPAALAAKALGGIMQRTPAGAKVLNGIKAANAAAGRAAAAAVQRAKALDAKTGRLASRAGKGVNAVRKTLGKPLSKSAELLAKRLSRTRSFRKIVVASYKAEKRVRAQNAARIAMANATTAAIAPIVPARPVNPVTPGPAPELAQPAPVTTTPTRVRHPSEPEGLTDLNLRPGEVSRKRIAEISRDRSQIARSGDQVQIRSAIDQTRRARLNLTKRVNDPNLSNIEVKQIKASIREARRAEAQLLQRERSLKRIESVKALVTRVEDTVKSKVASLTEKPLPAEIEYPEEFADFAEQRDYLNQRYRQMGLELSDDNTLRGSKTNRTRLSREIDELRDKQGYQVIGSHPTMRSDISHIKNPAKPNRGVVGQGLIENPELALRDLQRLNSRMREIKQYEQAGLGVANRDDFIDYGSPIVLTGDPKGNELARIVHKLSNRPQNRVEVLSDDADLGENTLGLASGHGDWIKIRSQLLLKDPEAAKTILLHEAKHISATKKGLSDRLIEFESPSESLGIGGYEKRLRADELEARIPEMAGMRNGDRGIGKRLNITSEAMRTRNITDLQRDVLTSFTDETYASARTFPDSVTLVTDYKGKQVRVNIDTTAKGREAQIEQARELVKRRLEVVESLDKHLQRVYGL